MTKKKILYLLLTVVVLVWGRILYSFIDFSADNPSVANIPVSNIKVDDKLMEESFKLLLNYKDPFLKNVSKSPPEIPNPNINLLVTSFNQRKEKEPIIWPQLTFKGRILNKESSRELAVLEINGKSYLLGPSEEIHGLKIHKLIGDSLYCNFLGSDTLLIRDPLAK